MELNEIEDFDETERDRNERQAAELYLELRERVENLPEFEGKIVLEEVLSKLSMARVKRGRELVEHRLTALRLQRIAGDAESILEQHLRSTYLMILRLIQMIRSTHLSGETGLPTSGDSGR